MLKFNKAWRFDSPGGAPRGVMHDFNDYIGKISAQGDQKEILEHFKVYFAPAAGMTPNLSTSASWAETDLQNYMEYALENAPLFIEAFFEACEALQESHPALAVPDVQMINRILSKHDTGYMIQPPDLITTKNQAEPIPVPDKIPSLDEQAQETIQKSLHEAERLLAEGRYRQAVQETLWLLETVSTAFQGLDAGSGTVTGKYFNRIVGDLRKHNSGAAIDQILSWMMTLHGYLSSPTGGGIRHGADLKEGMATQQNEARLYCNLIRSYISFLLGEYNRLNKK